MKKIGLLVIAASLSLSLAAFAGETSASNQGKSPSSQTDGAKAKGKGKARVDPATQQKMLNEQLATLKKEHQATVTELQGIKQLATKEKAPETAAALDKLIAKHEQEYQKRIEPLQQQLKKLEAAKKDAGDKTTKTDTGKTKTSN
jgi:hypothetical protein